MGDTGIDMIENDLCDDDDDDDDADADDADDAEC